MRRLLMVVLVLAALLVPLQPAAAAAPADYDIPNGHFYTQANGEGGSATGRGYAITNDDGVRFWDEFQRLGGVQELGYPASRRFMWDGFVSQATQRVILQWRPDVKQAYFINIFDKMHDIGLDPQLKAIRQVPFQLNDNGSCANGDFNCIRAYRQSWLDANPAIKQKYFSVSDPLQLNGLPTSKLDTSNPNFDILRCQRVVYQYWKVSVPGVANKGDVTVGLGGDIAKEFAVLPGGAATVTPLDGNPSAKIDPVPYLPKNALVLATALADTKGRGVADEIVAYWVPTGTGDSVSRIGLMVLQPGANGVSAVNLQADPKGYDLGENQFAQLVAQDINGDGKVEIALLGSVGAHSFVMSIFQWNGSAYAQIANFFGDAGMGFYDDNNDGVLEVRVGIRAYDRSQLLTVQGYRWNGKGYEAYRKNTTFTFDPSEFVKDYPEAAVVLYYNSLSKGDYTAAYNLLDPGNSLRQSNTPESYAALFKNTIGVDLESVQVVSENSTTASVSVQILAIDRSASGAPEAKRYAGAWQMHKTGTGWKLLSGNIVQK